jgi:hypothetical protein
MRRVGSFLLLLWLLLLAMGLMKVLEVLSSIFSSWRTFTSRRLADNRAADGATVVSGAVSGASDH